MRKFIKNLLKFIIKLLATRKKKPEIFLEFEKGIAYLAAHLNTIKLRKIINYEFRFDFKNTPLQCTEYVQYKIQQEIRIKIQWPVKSGRHGGKWPDIFEKYGLYKILGSPKSGCAVSFKERHGSHGHVAFVEKVLDNERIKISEANYPGSGKYSERTLSKSQWQDRYKSRFIDFS